MGGAALSVCSLGMATGGQLSVGGRFVLVSVGVSVCLVSGSIVPASLALSVDC